VGPREFHDEIPSTQDRAIELARSGSPPGTRVVARRQTRGRGRLDHAWVSPPGGLYISIVLRAPPDHVTWLPLALGARLAREFHDKFSLPFAVKWPNDLVLVDPPAPARKVAGILVDRVHDSPDSSIEVAGIGVNVTTEREEFPPELRARASSLAERVQPPPSLASVESVVVRSAMHAATGLEGPGGPEATRRLCRQWLFGVGHRATVDGRDAGLVAGLGELGEILLDGDAGRVAINAGDVRVEGVA
jgi:BirA family biotin operon repressor/biotin-[acetyl-CoA-carboxylase] ligase